MEEHGLKPDQLIAKAFLHSSRPGFEPNGKAEWVAAIKSIYKKKGPAGLWRLQKNHLHLYTQAVWVFSGLDEGHRFVGLDPEQIRFRSFYGDGRLNKELCHLRRQKFPLYPGYVMKHHAKVIKHAIRRHGYGPRD